ncbi:IS3 family transposase [Bradyrhizobium pachyrhizi]|uniref:IS3 family transposase n=1 Tax=Bradyrhizobium pachyrhizi TaxID=280333 RepID=UPI0009EA357F
MTAVLNGEGCRIHRKRVQRLMRKMGIAALGPSPEPQSRRRDTRSSRISCAIW